MGFREDLITDWTNKDIIYQGAKMLVLKQFEYEGTTYLYAIDKEDALRVDKEDVEVAFLYKIKDNIYANVDNDELFNELLAKVAGEITADKIKNEFQN